MIFIMDRHKRGMETMDAIYGRRSVRKYLPDPVPEDKMRMLMEAGCRAASALNAQGVSFAVVTDRDRVTEYGERGKKKTLEEWRGSERMNPHVERILTSERSVIFHRAPALIFLFTSPECYLPVEDASLVAGNIMTAAEDAGLGTCWIGLAQGLNGDPDFRRELGIPDDRTLRATITVGYPEVRETVPKEKNAPVIHGWIRQAGIS
ncbi:MAG: nitroreductase family protein [Thermoplasmatales archaeon]|jgi:nitroreductase|nr:nitroreductase family protein [Thermoplasmatales archaeon]